MRADVVIGLYVIGTAFFEDDVLGDNMRVCDRYSKPV
jgi:hypothetical protein